MDMVLKDAILNLSIFKNIAYTKANIRHHQALR
jgi:hypothetical protein